MTPDVIDSIAGKVNYRLEVVRANPWMGSGLLTVQLTVEELAWLSDHLAKLAQRPSE